MEITEQILQRLDRIERMLRKERKTKTWVKAGVIAKATGWDKHKMAQARENGYVEWKKDESGFFYNLDSLHPSFIKN